MEIINKEFIQELQSDQGTRIIGTGDIVPEPLTHIKIMRKILISKNIHESYKPYSMVIYGAYHRRDDLANKLRMIIEFKERIYIGDKKIKYFSDLDPYFKEYAEAFKEGFNNFEADNITPYLLQKTDKQDTINKIFEYVAEKPWHTQKTGFTVTTKNLKNKTYQIKGAREDGKAQGYLYRAWSAILANPNQFVPLFKDIRPTEPQHLREPQPIIKQKLTKKKYIVKEYALTYIFDLYANGQQVPIRRIDDRFDAIKIKEDVNKFPGYDRLPDSFYRAVKDIIENYDLNKLNHLKSLSKDWLTAVRELSNNWVITEQYLKRKNLIKE